MDDRHSGKQAAAWCAAEHVEDGMIVGLGTGSTAALFVRALGARVRAGLRVVGIPTSEAIARLARAEGIAVTALEEHPRPDIAIDGADAVDPALNLLKGLGGALLREQIVAAAAHRFTVIVDETKMVDALALAPVVPVEVVPFGWSHTQAAIKRLGAIVTRRTARDALDQPFITDGGHYVLDCHFADLSRPALMATRLKELTGVVDHGLFIGMACEVIVGSANGSVRVLRRSYPVEAK